MLIRDDSRTAEVDPLDAVGSFALALRVSFTDKFHDRGFGREALPKGALL